MSGEDTPDPRKLTFSQAYGYEELPQPLRLGELNRKTRVKLWNILYQHVSHSLVEYFVGQPHVNGVWKQVLVYLHEGQFGLPLDEFNKKFISFREQYKDVFMNASFNEVFDLLLKIMRHPKCPQDFIRSIAHVFYECQLAYVVDINPPATIYPAASGTEGQALLRATAELSSAGLIGAVAHLKQAADCIHQNDYSGAVRESIHAVESTARQIDPDAKTLEPALKKLEKTGALHPALKQAFSNLYGYTSDEQGIRHALINNPQPNVGQDEALFMLGACASFSSYLARKHRASTS